MLLHIAVQDSHRFRFHMNFAIAINIAIIIAVIRWFMDNPHLLNYMHPQCADSGTHSFPPCTITQYTQAESKHLLDQISNMFFLQLSSTYKLALRLHPINPPARQRINICSFPGRDWPTWDTTSKHNKWNWHNNYELYESNGARFLSESNPKANVFENMVCYTTLGTAQVHL